MNGKTKQNINPDNMDKIEYQLASIYNAIVELKNIVKEAPIFTPEELRGYIKILKEERFLDIYIK